MDGMLSQEEINALLSSTEIGNLSGQDDTLNLLSDMEKDTVGEVSNISMGTAATTLSSLLNQKVNISTPIISYAKWDDLEKDYDKPCVFLQISYKEGLSGNNILILKENDVKIITDLMMGGDGTNILNELAELHLSAISEAMNQMMGSASTSLSSMLGVRIDIRPPIASLIDLNENVDKNEISEFLNGYFVKVLFRMTIGDLVDSDIMQLFPVDFVKDLCSRLAAMTNGGGQKEMGEKQQNAENKNHYEQHVARQGMGQPAGNNAQNMGGANMQSGATYSGMNYGMQEAPMHDVNVQPAQFQMFSPDLAAVTQKENIELIMDVPLEVTAELGRTSKSIQDILEFAPGTIIELNKIAGEPIDVLVNGKLVAKGEVVVIEESFGVRVTEIVK